MRLAVFTVAALTLAMTGLIGPVAQAEETVREFEVTPGGRLEIDIEAGGIDVQVGDDDRVRIVARIRGSDADRFELDFRQDGADVRVRGRLTGLMGGYSSRNLSIDIRAEVPKRFDLELETSGGSIEVGDVDGEVDADTAGGSILIGRVKGPVRADTAGGAIEIMASAEEVDADTAGGSIHLGDIGGRIKADTSGGSIRVERALGKARLSTAGGGITVKAAHAAVDADTVGGGIKVDFLAQPDDRSRLSTTGGSVTVGIAEGVGFDVRGRSGSRVRSDFPIQGDDDDPGRVEGPVNGGGPRLQLSSSGRIRIEQR